MASDTRTPESKTIYIGEGALVYCFDFSDDPSVTGGATISSPVVTADAAKVSVAGSAVITQEFIEYDNSFDEQGNRNIRDSVPANQGVKVAITPLAKGETMVRCVVTASDGSTPGKTAYFTVK